MPPRTAPAMPEPELGTLDPIRHTTLSTVWDWSVREAGWSVDVFARMFATILVLRTVSQLVTTWWFPRTVWDASPTLVRGFGGTFPTGSQSANGTGADPEEEDDEPELVLVSDGERFYRHHTRHPSQYWPCPLLLQDRCRDCRWFTEDAGGQPRCAAIAKVMARHHVQFRHFGLEELRSLLERGRPGAFA